MPTLGPINKSVIGMSPTEFVIANAAASFISRHPLSSPLLSFQNHNALKGGCFVDCVYYTGDCLVQCLSDIVTITP